MGPFARALVEGSALLSLPLVSLGIFLAVFAAVVFRAFSAPKAGVDALARLPLDQDEETR